MVDVLVQIFYLMRPLMFAHVELSVLGLSVFEALTALMVGILGLALVFSPSGFRRPVDSLDVAMAAFVAWCIGISFIQYEETDLKITVRWLLPFAIYILLRRLVRTDRDYVRYLRILLVGFLLITLANAVAIYTGIGYLGANWFTGIERYKGVFHGVHTMAHTMAFGLFALAVYYVAVNRGSGDRRWRMDGLTRVLVVTMVPASLYCLVKGNVRTVLVGLAVFVGVALYRWRKSAFVAFVAAVLSVTILLPFLNRVFFDVPLISDTGSIEMAGSGRPFVWRHNLEIYADLPIEKKLIGVGVGNVIGQLSSDTLSTSRDRNSVWDSHNDFLAALMETGLIGLILVLVIHYLLLKAILRMPEPGKTVFLALFIAVVVMNFFSNSYLTRVGLGQLFMMVFVGAEVLGRGDYRQVVRRYAYGSRGAQGLSRWQP